MRSAMTLRRRDIFSVLPRNGEAGAACLGVLAAGAEFATAAGADAAAGAATGVLAGRDATAASMSCLRMRPPTPVPVTVLKSMLLSDASLRTMGVT